MEFDIRKLHEHEPDGCISTAIGELCVFCISYKDQVELTKDLGKPISKCEPSAFVRRFVRYICFPKSSLRDGKYKPDHPILTDDTTLSLTEPDLEAIAKLYVDINEYLFKKLLWKTKKDEKGETVNYTEYGEIEYPKKDSETYISYLHRLSVKEEEKQQRQMKKLLASASGLNRFSDILTGSIKNTLSMGDSLRRTLESIRPAPRPTLVPLEHDLPKIDWKELEENRLRPFNELAERLDQLIDSSVQASEFMIEANKIQTCIAGEIKASGDTATRLSKRNIKLSMTVIVISALALAISAYTIFKDNQERQTQRLFIERTADRLAKTLSDINANLGNDNQSLSKAFADFLAELRESATNESEYKALLEEQLAITEELRKSNNELKDKIEDLEAKVRKIESADQI